MIDHLGYVVRDVVRSKQFYSRALAPLDFSTVVEMSVTDGGGDGVGFGGGGVATAPREGTNLCGRRST